MARILNYVLVGCSIVLQVVAARYHALWLAWIGAAPFWLAVLLSAKRQPGPLSIAGKVAAAFLVVIAGAAVIVLILVFSAPVARRSEPTVQIPAPTIPVAPR